MAGKGQEASNNVRDKEWYHRSEQKARHFHKYNLPYPKRLAKKKMLFAFNGYIGDYANSKKTINKIIIKLHRNKISVQHS